MEVSIIKKWRQFRLRNIKASRDLRILIDVEFKTKVREALDLELEVPIPIVVNEVINWVVNDFICEVAMTFM